MVTIRKGTERDALILADVGKRSFIESHWKSAATEDIATYVSNNYSEEVFALDLKNPTRHYLLAEIDNVATGYSCISFNTPHDSIPAAHMAKLDRLYLLKEYYDKGIGHTLFDHNIRLCKEKGQTGIWLYVWKRNYRAISFYMKKGCTIIGTHDFHLTPTHVNPNYIMMLNF